MLRLIYLKKKKNNFKNAKFLRILNYCDIDFIHETEQLVLKYNIPRCGHNPTIFLKMNRGYMIE